MIVTGEPSLADQGHGQQAKAQAGPALLAAAKGKHKSTNVRLYFPKMDSEKGMRLFASKGCVACHSVNGVGGHDATALDAHTMKKAMNPFDFVAKMWRMASPMIAAQVEAAGEQITFTGDEIAHIVAFIHDDEQQHKFSEAMIPPKIKKMMNHTHGPKPKHQGEIGHRKGHMK
jgi:cytochrome c